MENNSSAFSGILNTSKAISLQPYSFISLSDIILALFISNTIPMNNIII
jgi:hypothetical protein